MATKQNKTNKLVKLSTLVSIRTGYSFRHKITSDPEGTIRVLQMRDLKDNYTTIENNASQFAPVLISKKEMDKKHLLQQGDVLFTSKGMNNKALVFQEDYAAVATSTFFILTIKTKYLMPEYLTWYINQQPAQRMIESKLEGSAQQNISLRSLAQLKIPIPPLEKQQQIVKLYELHQKEIALQQQIIEKRKTLINHILLNQL